MAKLSSINPLGYIINRPLNDKLVIKNEIFKERLARAKNLYRKDLFAHYGCVNAIEFSTEGELLVSGGDDRRVLLWSIPGAIHGKGAPVAMETNHISNIFCLAFDSTNSKIFSGGNDDQVIVHDLRAGSFVLKLLHKKPVYGLSINPQNDYIIATAGDDGRILIFDIRESNTTDPLCIAKQKTGFHSVMFNPFNSRLLATANSEEGISLWDYRKPKEALVRYDSTAGEVSGISVCFNSNGSRLLALRRRLPPVLYATQSQNAICQFYHPQYYNSCTMKTCCFAGDNDEYILSGSDDFNLYMWRVPKDSSEWGMSHVVLRGHRSIVNQVRYNKHNNLIASSGVEKMVKLWSTLPIGNWEGSLLKEHTDTPRSVYSHEDYVYLVGHTEQRISHDYSDQSVQEDSRMMAFFDSLIQREIEGWDSPSELTITSDSDSDNQDSNFVSWESLYLSKRWLDENSKKQKSNLITQLIAQKRKRLAKMAHHKSSSSVHRSNSKQNRRKRKSSNTLKNSNLGNKFTKNNGTPKKACNKKDDQIRGPLYTDRENRKHKLHLDKSERITRSKKCKTRQNFKDICENSISNSSIDAPSTSTGITSSNTVYRLVEQDSDEEAPVNGCYEDRTNSEQNFVNILPTPLNGTHDMCLNALDITNHNNNGNVVALRNDYIEVEIPSTSTVNNGHSKIVHKTCHDGPCLDKFANGDIYNNSYVNSDPYMNNNNNNSNSFVNDSDSSECEYDCTPVKKVLNSVISTPDSGFATGPCSSSSGYVKRNSNVHLPRSSRSIIGIGHCNDLTSDDSDYPYEKFRKRAKKARLNIRKKICGDSDSN